MEILPIKTPLLKARFSLEDAIVNALRKNRVALKNGDVLVISSKIVSLAEGGLIDLKKIRPSARARKLAKFHFNPDPRVVELILREADEVFVPRARKVRHVRQKSAGFLTTIKNGILIPAAGIDLSNAPPDHAIVWPRQPWKTAEDLAKSFRVKYRLKNFGVVISDSRCTPLRWGTTGLALSWTGFEGIEDARGQKDIYGKRLKITKKAAADNLASAALLVMGEAGERIPVAVVRGAPMKFTVPTGRQAKNLPKADRIIVPPDECVYSGIYTKKFRS